MKVNKPINIILQVHINYNNFFEDYQKNYLDKIKMAHIRKLLNISDCDYLKKNGTWERNLFFTENKVLNQARVKIQKLQWTTAAGDTHYISIWPNFIIKYSQLTTDLIEIISINIKKGEDIFKCIADPKCLLECEDLLHKSTHKVNQTCLDKKYSALLNANYTRIYGREMEISIFKWQSFRYPDILLLIKLGMVFKGGNHSILSYLNYRFNFLR